MIINIRGGSGSGKSTIIRAIMEQYPSRIAHYVEGRKRPLWYDLYDENDNSVQTVRLLGHYESECGGCDTLSKNPENKDERAMDFIHRLIREGHERGYHVLYEGLMLTTLHRRLGEIVKDFPGYVVCVCLDSDLELCLSGISERRARKKFGPNVVFDEVAVDEIRAGLEEKTVKNNQGKLKSHAKTAAILEQAGATILRGDREQCLGYVEEILKL